MKPLKVALVQQSCTDDKAGNLAKSITAIREAARLGAQLVVLQELHAGLYFCQQEDTGCFDQAEPIPGPSSDLLASIARDCRGIGKGWFNCRNVPEDAHPGRSRVL
jgi:N-carbamoylputrescine amidase